jgi:NitT/TauT family transport system substrate-binding protein
MKRLIPSMLVLALGALLAGCGARERSDPSILRIGHFPNITHAQALVAHALSRQGRGWFEERLGPGIRVEWFVYHAGPSAMEAIFAGSLDATYVGPNPALNAHLKSGGDEIRIIAGAARGGAALLVPAHSPVSAPGDFRGRTIATPQLGNTQDVACRSWLAANGFRITQMGGDVTVLPVANPEMLLLFRDGRLDAAWTVEPWVSILERDLGARIFLEEPEAITTVLASSAALTRERPRLAAALATAHAELTRWIGEHPDEARRLVSAELQAETGRALSGEIVAAAWQRLEFTTDIALAPLEQYVDAAKAAGFLRETVGLERLLELPR